MLFLASIENLKNLNYHTSLKKALVLSIICSKCKNNQEKNIERKRVNWDIKDFWFNWKYVITLKIWLKKI